MLLWGCLSDLAWTSACDCGYCGMHVCPSMLGMCTHSTTPTPPLTNEGHTRQHQGQVHKPEAAHCTCSTHTQARARAAAVNAESCYRLSNLCRP